MTNGELAFMALAEELSFTHAAERMFMSQQGLSDHIKRIEQEYNAVLVNRKPFVSLTESGAALYDMLSRKAAMEKDIKRLINDINKGDAGDIYFGITSTWARVFISRIVQTFYEKHPGIKIHIETGSSADLIQMLIHGQLDCVIGKNPVPVPEIDIEFMFNDPVYIAMPEAIAQERFGDATTVRIEDCLDLKFIRGRHMSEHGDVIDTFTGRKNVHLNNIITVDDTNVQAALCVRLNAAMFCAKTFAFFEGSEIRRKNLRIMNIEGLTYSDEVGLVTMKNRTYPASVLEFMDIIRESLDRFYNKKIVE